MKSGLVLSLFPGIGLLDRAFEAEGFCVVRGPDVLWGGDVRRFHPPAGRFDGVIGGPPCQSFSSLRHIIKANGHEPQFGNLIPDFERCVGEARPAWFLMENVRDAPVPQVPGYQTWSTLLDNRQLGEAQRRIRRWSFGAVQRTVLMIDTVALESIEFEYAATGAGARRVPVAIGGTGKPKRNRVGRDPRKDVLSDGTQKTRKGFIEVRRLQGLPTDFELPPFTVAAAVKAVANGVPMAMGRAIVRAVKEAIAAGDEPAPHPVTPSPRHPTTEEPIR